MGGIPTSDGGKFGSTSGEGRFKYDVGGNNCVCGVFGHFSDDVYNEVFSTCTGEIKKYFYL